MTLFLNEKEVVDILPVSECVDVLDKAFACAGDGFGENVPRSRIRMPKGFLHFMAAATLGPNQAAFGYKAYTSFPGGLAKSLVLLYHWETGELLAVMEANALGQIRTGAASGLATRHMAKADASTIGIIGTGYQARTQLEAVCSVRDIKSVKAFSRTAEKRQDFTDKMSAMLNLDVVPADSCEECIRGVDIAITVTSSKQPVISGEWLEDGCHVNAAGGNHWIRREIDHTVVNRADTIVVDNLEQAKLECGDLLWPAERGLFHWSMAHELKDVVSGKTNGRTNENSITLFESQGIALEDVAAAIHVYHKARQRGMGQELPF